MSLCDTRIRADCWSLGPGRWQRCNRLALSFSTRGWCLIGWMFAGSVRLSLPVSVGRLPEQLMVFVMCSPALENKQTPWDLWLSTNLQLHSFKAALKSGFSHPTASECWNDPIFVLGTWGSASRCVYNTHTCHKIDRPNYHQLTDAPVFNMHFILHGCLHL